MPLTPVVAILDVGKTNKKLFLFDAFYKIRWESSCSLAETRDGDGDPCEDLAALNRWIAETLTQAKRNGDFDIRAINFSAYGASFVYIGENGEPLTPLYNYLKPYPAYLSRKFYGDYGGELTVSLQTASPILGSLNSGLQVYRIKNEKPKLFGQIKYALHLPQYLSWLLTGTASSDITSIGCHTHLWDFNINNYHAWVQRESVLEKLPPLRLSETTYPLKPVPQLGLENGFFGEAVAGIGLHDSSAAMIPYLESFQEPFVLISTGTWCISMNPFNAEPLTRVELENDCLCYLTFKGRPMKASRLFAGQEHETQTERVAVFFQKEKTYYQTVTYEAGLISLLKDKQGPDFSGHPVAQSRVSVFAQRNLSAFASYEEAYHRLMMDLMDQQFRSTSFILAGQAVKRIFVDGGFSKNQLYMHLLAAAFPGMEVFAASMAQASAVGAAMAIHPGWNEGGMPTDIIELKYYKQ